MYQINQSMQTKMYKIVFSSLRFLGLINGSNAQQKRLQTILLLTKMLKENAICVVLRIPHQPNVLTLDFLLKKLLRLQKVVIKMTSKQKEANVLENPIRNSNRMNAHKFSNFSAVIKRQLIWVQNPIASKVCYLPSFRELHLYCI
jgi:hypothetical protein